MAERAEIFIAMQIVQIAQIYLWGRLRREIEQNLIQNFTELLFISPAEMAEIAESINIAVNEFLSH